MLLCMSCFSMIFVPLFNLFVSRLRYSLMNEREVHVIVLHFLCSTLPTFVFFEGSNALNVTVHFARPRGILVVAQPSSHQVLHSAHHG